MIILASTSTPTERTLFSYIPASDYLGYKGKSFALHKAHDIGNTGGVLHNLPVSHCTVEPEEEGYVKVHVPEWLVKKKKSFFES